ncbi:putative TRAP-T dicarboxylate transporter DctP subunit [Pseudorhizobium banfieldiae]|uniref:Putative TRAP-T dicarboxylate transporter DctP subunit n=1 Tax=Pseudorhizobium banfieldiae TaxID=1125847 RepID=L0NDD9_9HYPH|nr:TRAP transporter substrate-binding protein DctP [Pseudorhizobium banfieldiae]CAD6601933.1 C4-dicarboxylate ABC transporter substrate-binding protein [arsenite-oxidising bacterium NT-25]CAD6606346.1 C4-dicarboxylate ABC transporter substrate-binding protein [Rhizobium sp. TCK]CCF18322.1 putative TRAP-T dicarboxylate transporter DctP subunit [Pseudorhizobium banfieldiae]
MKLTKLTAMASAMVLWAAAANAETYTYITYKPQGANDAHANSLQWLVDEFKKRTGGKHEIQMFWGGSVAAVGETPDALASGVGDMGDIVTPYFPDQFPLNNAIGFFIPQPLDSAGVAEAMVNWHATYPQFAEELAQDNLHAFSFRALENYGLLCKEPVDSLDDLKGKRIRSYGFAYPALIEAMGATPVSITTSDTYEALERSIVDCAPIGPALARGFKYDEVAKYYIEIPFGASFGHLLTINLDTYKGMDEETRATLDQLGKDYMVEYGRMLADDEKRVRDLWNGDLGVTVTPFPAEHLKPILEDPKVKAVREEWQAKAEAAGLPVDKIVSDLQF